MFSLFLASLVLSVPATQGRSIQGESAPCAICGEWEGKIDFGTALQPIRVQLTQSQSGELRATLDLPTVGVTGRPLRDVTIGDSVRFLYDGRQGVAEYTGKLQPDAAITGWFRQGELAGSFYLVREIPVDLELNKRVAGSYRLADDRFLDVGPFSEDGNRLGMYDSKTQRYHVLRATSDSQFFAGASVGVAYPKSVLITVERRNGQISGLRWKEAGGEEMRASRIAPFVEEEIEFRTGDVIMRGTLTKPLEGDRHPVVVMVPGSMTGPPRPAGYWPYFMVRHGVAMVTFDKRGTGGSAGDWRKVGYEEQAQDLLSLVSVLRQRADVDTARLGLWGNSEGGWTAPLAASRSRDVKFLIIKSSSALPVRDAVAREAELRLRDGTGLSDSDVRAALTFKQSIEALALAAEPWNRIWMRIDSAYATVRGQDWFNFVGEAPKDHWWWGWWRLRGSHDPFPVLTAVKVPTLVLLGENDCCMPPARENAAAFERAFEVARNRQASVRVLSKGSHGLMEVESSVMSAGPRATRYVPGYLDGIAEWLRVNGISVR
jgi:pimeloyl-ACP methyl ester carboxylesterase